VPEEGAANDAAARVVADWLGVARSSVTLVGGAKSRIKTFEVGGDGAALAAVAAMLLARAPASRGTRHA
jgi:uncharacterized protein YggU (UPF0235/DUF167 family)